MELKEVKEYFKNAKIVKDSDGDIVDLSKVDINDMWKSDTNSIYIDNHKNTGVRLWHNMLGLYSEIIETTTPMEWRFRDFEIFSKSEGGWIALTGSERLRLKTDNTEKIKALEYQKLELEKKIAELKC
jgi:hypothetical protein